MLQIQMLVFERVGEKEAGTMDDSWDVREDGLVEGAAGRIVGLGIDGGDASQFQSLYVTTQLSRCVN